MDVKEARQKGGIDHGHGLHDPHDASAQDGWYPITPEAMRLSLCVESCKQINELRAMFLEGELTARKLTVLATPVHNLVKYVLLLRTALGRENRSYWAEEDRRRFESSPRALRRAETGALATIRSRRSAHTDAEAYGHGTVPESSPENVVRPLGEALVLLLLCLNHRTGFGYARRPQPDSKDEIEFYFQYPVATRVRLDEKGSPKEILGSHLEADPRHELGAVVLRATELYNLIARRTSQPAIRVRQYSPGPSTETATP